MPATIEHDAADEADDHVRPQPAADATLLARGQVIAQLRARQCGALDDAALARWAFDQFYAIELGQVIADGVVEQVLDELMFVDDGAFAIATDRSEALIAMLEEHP